ncbi:MAG: hypothetical protein JSW73_02590 [Candidatus Woesearchaeota archaeon]|nr:MAG: hypothetical protein JSW73_02590 [Candidatus Woesearchaeota archaeon]
MNKFKGYINKIKGFRISVMLLVESGIEDTLLTLESISKYGIEIEANPILREVVKHLGAVPGLLSVKVLVLAITVYTAHMMNKTNCKIRGEYLLYGASICWLYGAVSNLLLDQSFF